MMIPSRRLTGIGAPYTMAAVLVACLGLLPDYGWAQLPQARLDSLFPTGGRVGETIEVQLNGADLEGADRLWFSHSGITARHVDANRFQVAIAPETPIGQHDVRVIGTYGISNPRTFVVGELPVQVEVEPNDTPDQATVIAPNQVVYGRTEKATDIDVFAFEGKAGQRLLIDLEAYRIESRLDGWLRVFDPSGREIADSQDERDLDPFVDLTPPSDGRYRIQVQDVVYSGSTDHVYRLAIRDGPYLDAVDPRVVTPGQDVTLTLYGRNIGGTVEPSTTVNGHVLERKEVAFHVPERTGTARSTLVGSNYLEAVGAGRDGFEYRYQGETGTSNPIFLALADGPVVAEQEPNDDPEHARALVLPCDVSGVFRDAGDLDRYQFEAKKGETYWFEVQAERIGSPADPNLIIQQVGDDGALKDLEAADDLPAPRNFPISTSTVDTATRWQAPADGTFQVVLSDLYGSRRGDVRLAYHLNIRKQQPDFRLFVVPISTDPQPLGLTVRAGGSPGPGGVDAT